MRHTLLVLLIALLGVLSVHAQVDADDATNPLLEMLALVPDTTKFRKLNTPFVGFIDYRAVEHGRQTPVHPENFAEFETLDEEKRSIWLAATARIATGPPLFRYLREAGGMVETMGFDLFDVDHAMKYGRPPQDVSILSGVFNTDTIESALKKEYRAHDIGGVSVWRRFDGKSDSSSSIKERNLANPFGGHLGRKQPIAIIPVRGDKVNVVSSADWEAVINTVRTLQGETPSLAESVDYRTLVEAITDRKHYKGDLLQVQFLTAFEASMESGDLRKVTKSAFEAGLPNIVFAPEMCGYGDLPPFSLAVLVDRQEGNNQVAIVALLYGDAETVGRRSAAQAAKELANRLVTFSGAPDNKGRAPIIEDYFGDRASVDKPYVYTSDTTGRSAAVVAIRYPTPSDKPDETGRVAARRPAVRRPADSGMLFRRWIQAVYQRSFYPLWQIVLPDWMIEKFCK